MVDRRKKEFDVLVKNLDMLEETKMNDLNNEVINLKFIFSWFN